MFIKTGQLANRAGILHPVGQTPGGYCLFDGAEAVERLREIDELQSKQRLTIREIKQKLGEAEVDDH